MAMRAALLIGLAAAVLGGGAEAQTPAPTALPEKLTGDRIKEAWFDGKPFNAVSPDGAGFVMTFHPDGKANRRPAEKKKGLTSASGFWRAIAEGYCSRWSGQNREKCFNVRPNPEGDGVVVRFGTQLVANWKR
jgi:hypothetical protein